MAICPVTQATKEEFDIRWDFGNSDYGPREMNGQRGFHRGVDLTPIINPGGDIEIIATVAGIAYPLVDNNGALYVYIHGDNNEGHMNVHLKEFLVDRGQRVEVGDVVGLMGNTGNSTGIHDHFETRKDYRDPNSHYDPEPFTYYEGDMSDFAVELETAKKWKGDVLDKYGIELMDRVDGTTMTREEYLVVLHRFKDYLQASPAV